MHERTPETPQFSSPEEELAHLRARTVERAETEQPQSYEQAARRELGAYSKFTPRSVLKEHYILDDAELDALASRLNESSNRVLEFVDLAETRGIKNTLEVLERQGDAYLTDEVHRKLAGMIRAGRTISGMKEGAPLWNVLNMTLFEVTLPEAAAEDGREEALRGLVSSMEQFYAGMRSISPSRGGARHMTLEIAVSDKSDDIVFYVAVPTASVDLFEKQLLSLFPYATLTVQQNDYNIFVDGGASLIATASLSKHPIYPIRSYETFDRDPLNVILNALSKLDRDGGGAAVQLVLRPGENTYHGAYAKAVDRVRKGMPVKQALSMLSTTGEVLATLKEFTFSKKKQDDLTTPPEVDTTAIERFEEKLARPIYAANIRIAASAETEERARHILGDIEASFHQFEHAQGNRIQFEELSGRAARRALRAFSFREFTPQNELPLSITELSTLMHFPVQGIHFSPQFKQSRARTVAAPLALPREGTLLGVNVYRGAETQVRITPDDRLRHFYIIGQTGTGKTTLMKNMIAQDIEDGAGVCMIDPHGTDIADVLGAIPPEREQDVIYFDPAHTERAVGLNMLEYDAAHPEQKTFVVNELFSIFQKLYGAVPESMGPMFEQYFRNATLLVLEDPSSGSTLMDVSRVLSDSSYRKLKLSRAQNPVVRQFWEEIATKAGGEAALENIVPYITSKFDIFTANDYMRPIIGQQESSFNFRRLMDERKILLVNLSKGRIGEINANLIGMIVVGKILMAALSRVDTDPQSVAPFYLHMDEFQNVTTDSIAAILSEARKYRLGLTIAHQYVAQLDERIRDAVFGNVGSIAAFRVGPEDAEYLERQYAPTFSASDLMNIENRQAYVRLLAHGTPTKPFNIATLPPRPVDADALAARIDRLALQNGRLRTEVEAEIAARYQRTPAPEAGGTVV